MIFSPQAVFVNVTLPKESGVPLLPSAVPLMLPTPDIVTSEGVLEGLGYQGDVPSPTFTIMNHYAPPDTRVAVIHADLYRLNSLDELQELGMLDSDDGDTVSLVEWPEQGGDAFSHARFRISIAVTDENSRILTIEENI